MKPGALLFAVSAAVNLACLSVIAIHPHGGRAFFGAQPATAVGEAPQPAPEPARGVVPPPRAETSSVSPRVAATLDPQELRETLAALRAADVSPTLRLHLGMALLRQHFDARRADARGTGPAEYWRLTSYAPDAAAQATRRSLDNELRRLQRELWGADAHAIEDVEFPERRAAQYGALSDEKVARIRKLFADYDELADQAFAERPSRVTAEGRAKTALLEKEKRADLERLLTAEELLDYDLRNSVAAGALRSRLGQFEATEAEFRALYPVEKMLSDAFAGVGRGDNAAEMRQRRGLAEAALMADFRRLLGEARFAEFQRANDGEIPPLRAFAVRHRLDDAMVDSIAAIQKHFSTRSEALDADRDLSPNQRDAQRTIWGHESAQQLASLLGEPVFAAYRSGEGRWLDAALEGSAR